MLRCLLVLLFLLLADAAKAQIASQQRQKIIKVSLAATIPLDSLSIVPQSLKINVENGLSVDSSLYSIDYAKAVLHWKGSDEITLSIRYRVFPILFSKSYYNKDIKQIEQLPIDNSKWYVYKPQAPQNTLFTLDGLNKSGSISRGVMFGNNQNLSVNSNMVLQMSGKIVNDIEISAAISDDNLPIQPDGNTQQLNDFDRVFIQVKKDSTILIAGDYELNRPNSYFMNFFKRTQGAMISHDVKLSNGVKSSTSIAIAVAKGRSARQDIEGQEGNQGPYRLNGNNGEAYIVVIAGTERVFLDGIPLLRGQDNDYVMDYNTAEITFTAKQMINLNSRINVEFEYSDKNYSRSLNYLNQRFETEKIAFRINYYNEKDNKNQPFLQSLSDDQKQFMASLGRNISQAFYPNVREVDFNDNEILYEKVTPPVGEIYYRYATDPQVAKYSIGFSFVGDGQGNYELNGQSSANGKVYKYVPTISGLKQGSYEPITLLITPKQQQLITVGADFKPKEHTIFSAELAVSQNNLNLFADKNVGNISGYGLKLAAAHQFLLNEKGLKLNTSAQYEFVTDAFKPVERYRSIEFNRDFNLENIIDTAAEHLVSVNAQLYQTPEKNISYTLNTFTRDEFYQGYRHQLQTNYKLGKYKLRYNGSALNTNTVFNSGALYKQNLDLHRPLFDIILGVYFEQEHNRSANKNTLDLTGNSAAYQLYKFYIHSRPSESNRYKLDYTLRQDQLPRGDQLLNSSYAESVNFGMELTKNANSVLNLIAGYRKTGYTNNFATVSADESLVGRMDYNLNALKGFVNTSVYYEVGNGQEPRREVTYLEVLPGQGAYAWNDYNGNGIKELDEFEVSRFPDQAKYIRIFTSSTQYVRTNFTGVNQSIRITPSALLKGTKGLSKFVNRFTNQLSYKIDRKILAGSGLSVYNPFNTEIDATNLISLTSFFRNTLFFNRSNPKLGIDFNYIADGSKSFLSNGFDSRKREEVGLRLRTAPNRTVNLQLTLNSGSKNFNSELFIQRNYLIKYIEVLPEFNYQFSTDFRLTLAAAFGKQRNAVLYGGEKNTNATFTTESRYNILKKGVLTGKLSYINNKFDGIGNSTIGYEMLSGLQTGNNYTWGLGLQRTIGNGVQLNVSYEGRKSATVDVVHTGNMQVRAYF